MNARPTFSHIFSSNDTRMSFGMALIKIIIIGAEKTRAGEWAHSLWVTKPSILSSFRSNHSVNVCARGLRRFFAPFALRTTRSLSIPASHFARSLVWVQNILFLHPFHFIHFCQTITYIFPFAKMKLCLTTCWLYWMSIIPVYSIMTQRKFSILNRIHQHFRKRDEFHRYLMYIHQKPSSFVSKWCFTQFYSHRNQSTC